MTHKTDKKAFSDNILRWYDNHARELPWRARGGQLPDPYHVWLSEIMLQQTTVPTVGPYFALFTERWPTVSDLAKASLDDVLSAWAGLGYYARARNLHKCANEVWQNLGGAFPGTEEALLKLPGVGPYTAAAIAAIAFDQPAVVVDGNIERIVSRVFRISDPLPGSRPLIKEAAAKLSPTQRPGDYAQALMDIGSSICRPKKPLCAECPVQDLCEASEAGDMETYPVKAPKKEKPVRRAAVLWVENDAGEILMRRRPEKGLLGGMMEFPSTEWEVISSLAPPTGEVVAELFNQVGLAGHAPQQDMGENVKHTFTHFHLHFYPVRHNLNADQRVTSNEVHWVHPQKFDEIALPTLMRKVVKLVRQMDDRLL